MADVQHLLFSPSSIVKIKAKKFYFKSIFLFLCIVIPFCFAYAHGIAFKAWVPLVLFFFWRRGGGGGIKKPGAKIILVNVTDPFAVIQPCIYANPCKSMQIHANPCKSMLFFAFVGFAAGHV
jgi:hypothetical protein